MIVTILFLLTGCAEEEPVDLGDPADQLEIPPLDGVDLEALVVDALALAIAADARIPWQGHAASFDYMDEGCPDLYAGAPDLELDGFYDEAPGLSWADHCDSGALSFGGFQYWEHAIDADGDASTDEGQTIFAERSLLGDGLVAQEDAVLFEFDGEASDALNRSEAVGYSRWTYSSRLDATVTGSLAMASTGTPGGFRADTTTYYAGGDTQDIEIRGNVYLFEERLADRFDSVALDLEFASPESTSPEECALEPSGWIGVRDEQAWWYDVVFAPRHSDGEEQPNDPYTACDGCGMLYVRGIAQDVQVCPDLSWLWSGALVPPDPSEFALSLREFVEDP